MVEPNEGDYGSDLVGMVLTQKAKMQAHEIEEAKKPTWLDILAFFAACFALGAVAAAWYLRLTGG